MLTGAILLAAGRSARFRKRRPKQLLPLGTEPLFMKSLRVFAGLPTVREIALVVPPGRESAYKKALRFLPERGRAKTQIVAGGAFRGASVRNGLRVLSDKAGVVLVHDAARALVTPDVVKRVEREAARTGAAVAAWPVADTMKLSGPSRAVKKTVSRKDVWLAQTPQGFGRDVIVRAYIERPAGESFTDDASLIERAGGSVEVVESSHINFKITTPEDLEHANAVLAAIRGGRLHF